MELEPNRYYFLESVHKAGHYLHFVTKDEYGMDAWPEYHIRKGTHGAAVWKGKHIPRLPGEAICSLDLNDFNPVLVPTKKVR